MNGFMLLILSHSWNRKNSIPISINAMFHFRLVLVSFCLIFLPSFVTAQNITDELIEDITETLQDEEFEFDDYDVDLITNKLFINRISDENIMQLPYLSLFQKNKLIEYRKQWGNILSSTELFIIEGFNNDYVVRLLPHIDFSEKIDKTHYSPEDYIKQANFDFLMKVSSTDENKIEYFTDDVDKKYNGDRHKVLFKFKYNLDDCFRAGLFFEKDAGESFFNKYKKKPEHISGFLQFNGRYINCIVGDYYIQFGQGLSMWNGTYFGGGVESVSQIRFPCTLKPSSGSDEVDFLRGGVVNTVYNRFSATAFVSLRQKDATIKYDEVSDSYSFSSLRRTGYHRNNNEVTNCNNIDEFVVGAKIGYSYKDLKIEADFGYLHYSIPFIPEKTMENLFRLSGNENYAYSINYINTFKKSYIYGETSMSKSGGFGLLTGWFINANEYIDIDLLYNYISKNYYGLYNSVSGLGGVNSICLKVNANPTRSLTLYSLINLSESKWFTRTKTPFKTSTSVKLRLKYDITKYINVYLGSEFSGKSLSDSYKLRFNVECMPYDFLTLRTRIELKYFGSEVGNLFYSDIAFRLKFGLMTIVRLTCFDTDSYNTRIYCYENDVLYSFSSPAYYGRGNSVMFLLRYKITNHLSFWVKVSNTKKYDQEGGKGSYTLQIRYKV